MYVCAPLKFLMKLCKPPESTEILRRHWQSLGAVYCTAHLYQPFLTSVLMFSLLCTTEKIGIFTHFELVQISKAFKQIVMLQSHRCLEEKDNKKENSPTENCNYFHEETKLGKNLSSLCPTVNISIKDSPNFPCKVLQLLVP